jgi:hypothetical protein
LLILLRKSITTCWECQYHNSFKRMQCLLHNISAYYIKLSTWSALYTSSQTERFYWVQFWQAIAQTSELSFNRLAHTELRSSFMETQSFLSLPDNITMASSQGTQHSTSFSRNSFSRWTSHDIFLFKYHFLLHILPFLFFFSDSIMVDVAIKQQTTALFYPAQSHTQEDTQKWKKKETDKSDEKSVLCQRTFNLYSCRLFTQLNCTV